MKCLKLAAILLFVAVSCSDDDASINTSGDYFPLKNLNWRYSRTIIFSSELPAQDFGKITLQTAGKVFADGKIYTRITGWDGYIDYEVRRDGSEYFERNALLENNKEYKFLDTKKGVGESWSYTIDEHIKKIKYTVLSKNPIQEVGGIAYKNVITIGVEYYHTAPDGVSTEQWLSSQHIYAEGVGEVYNFKPYPLSGTYGDVKSNRIK